MLDWEESDLVAAFEAVPTYEEDGNLYLFSVTDEGARVVIGVWPSHSEVSIAVHVGDRPEPIYWSGFVPCTAVRRRREKSGLEAVEVCQGEDILFVITIKPRLRIIGTNLVSKST